MGLGQTMSPETISTVFPDRLIHPLPKRRLRERLSPNVADSIQYPPAHVSGTPLFYYPYSLKDSVPGSADRATLPNRGRTVTTPASTTSYTDTPVIPHARRGSEGNGPVNSPRVVRLVNRSARHQPTLVPSPPASHQTATSAASSVDGYDSFENTNNKKKRKIPTASDASHTVAYTATDIHTVSSGPSSVTGNDEGVNGSSNTCAGSASFVAVSPGISGPGRGRYGRIRNGRSPLRPLTDAGNNWAARGGKSQSSWPAPIDIKTRTEAASVLKNAISSIFPDAEKHASEEQENSITPPEQPPMIASPTSAQFTFTCTSQVPGNLTWVASDPKMPSASAQWQQNRLRSGCVPAAAAGTHDKNWERSETDRSRRCPRTQEKERKENERAELKKLNRELFKQARDRKRAQQRQNMITPPTGEMYICPFCEYETFYKKKPKSFIRSFELRERKKREQAEERQRLLDKAKARGRKGKKAGKTAAKAGGAGENQTQSNQPGDEQQDDLDGDTGEGDGYYEDDDGSGEQEDLYGGHGLGFGALLPDPDGGPRARTKAGLDSVSVHSLRTYHFPLIS